MNAESLVLLFLILSGLCVGFWKQEWQVTNHVKALSHVCIEVWSVSVSLFLLWSAFFFWDININVLQKLRKKSVIFLREMQFQYRGKYWVTALLRTKMSSVWCPQIVWCNSVTVLKYQLVYFILLWKDLSSPTSAGKQGRC